MCFLENLVVEVGPLLDELHDLGLQELSEHLQPSVKKIQNISLKNWVKQWRTWTVKTHTPIKIYIGSQVCKVGNTKCRIDYIS